MVSRIYPKAIRSPLECPLFLRDAKCLIDLLIDSYSAPIKSIDYYIAPIRGVATNYLKANYNEIRALKNDKK